MTAGSRGDTAGQALLLRAICGADRNLAAEVGQPSRKGVDALVESIRGE